MECGQLVCLLAIIGFGGLLFGDCIARPAIDKFKQRRLSHEENH